MVKRYTAGYTGNEVIKKVECKANGVNEEVDILLENK